MSERLDQLGTNTVVVLLTFTEPKNLVNYQATNALPFPVLVDAGRSSYRAYGLGQGSLARIYGWRSARRYLQIFWESGFRRLHKATEDPLQLGGDFIVSPKGTLIYGFWGKGPDDRPSVDDLIAAIPKESL